MVYLRNIVLARSYRGGRAHRAAARLDLSPQCGFVSTVEGNRVTPEDQRAKLRRVAETARLVWDV
jgi:5-methyltetrahydropteroyltriglutamate--homocysteine methyltransferase